MGQDFLVIQYCFMKGKRLRYFDPDVHEYMQRVVNELDGGKFSELLNSDLNTKVSYCSFRISFLFRVLCMTWLNNGLCACVYENQ